MKKISNEVPLRLTSLVFSVNSVYDLPKPKLLLLSNSFHLGSSRGDGGDIQD